MNSKFKYKYSFAYGKHLIMCAGFLVFFSVLIQAETSMAGQSGLVNMPDARISGDGGVRFGVSYWEPYFTSWVNISFLPRLEISGRHMDFDDALDTKLLLVKEGEYLPNIAIGAQDIVGNRNLEAYYTTLTKHIWNFDITAGFGGGRIDGIFGGLRYVPDWNKHLAFVAEYDNYDYLEAFKDEASNARNKRGKETFAIEYSNKWFGLQIAYQDSNFGINTSISLPLHKHIKHSKIYKPDPYTKPVSKIRYEEWSSDTRHKIKMYQTLYDNGFRNIILDIENEALNLSVTHPSISIIGRAVGRAARIANAYGPIEIKELIVTYTENDVPIVTYHIERHKFQRYLDGLISKRQLTNNIDLVYSKQNHRWVHENAEYIKFDSISDYSSDIKYMGEYWPIFGFRIGDEVKNSLQFIPFNLGDYLSDSNGDFRYEIFSLLKYRYRISHGLYFDSAIRYRLFDDFDVKQSNSELPHVRSDVALYKRGNRLKLDSLLLNKFWYTGSRIYTRLSAGLYEEMFGGIGGQVLYLPEGTNWAVDFAVDWLKQRDVDGDFEFRSYDVVSALASLHYRIPRYGVTMTMRAGQFLARDEGIRFEIKRRFHSGIEVGFWHTFTNGDDEIMPGSRGNTYYDKGLTLTVPLEIFGTRDTRAKSTIRWTPHTRDVGQMVRSPADLYDMVEDPLMFGQYPKDVLSDLGQ